VWAILAIRVSIRAVASAPVGAGVGSGVSAGTGRLFVYVLDCIARLSPATLAAHRQYLRSLGPRLVVGGPFRDGRGSVVCVVADSEASADAMARADPLVVFGFTLYQLHEIERVEQVAAHAPA